MRVFRFCIRPRPFYAWLRQDKKRRRAARKERREHRRDLLFNRATAAAAAGGGGGGAGGAEDGANSNVSSKVRASAEVFLSEVLGVGAAPAVGAPKLAPNKVALTNIVAGVLDHNERVQEEGDAAAHRRLADLNSEHTHTLATPLPPPTYQPPSHASQGTNRPQLPPCYDGSGGARVPPPNAHYNAGSTAPYNAASSYYHQRACGGSGGAWEAYQAYDQAYGGTSGVTRHARHVSHVTHDSLLFTRPTPLPHIR
jgi:hypothetical protein